jgi:alanyl-tRNA synthetase
MTDETTEVIETTEAPATEAPAIDPAAFAAMQAEVERLRKHSETLLAEKKQTAEQARKAQEEAARKSGDMEALEKSWAERETARLAEREEEIKQRDQMLQELTVGSEAVKMASELAMPGCGKAIEREVKSRLRMEIRDGKPVAVVLDSEGKPSAMTLDDLRKEIQADPAFAPLLVGTRASGAGGVAGKGGAQSLRRSTMTAAEKAAYLDEHGQAEFLKLPK